jgi:hypothetical protein
LSFADAGNAVRFALTTTGLTVEVIRWIIYVDAVFDVFV